MLNGANTAWILTATALVLFMTIPGLSLFYAGLVGRKNVLSVLMHCFMITAIMSVLWVVCGYSIALGTGNSYWGGLENIFAKRSRVSLVQSSAGVGSKELIKILGF